MKADLPVHLDTDGRPRCAICRGRKRDLSCRHCRRMRELAGIQPPRTEPLSALRLPRVRNAAQAMQEAIGCNPWTSQV